MTDTNDSLKHWLQTLAVSLKQHTDPSNASVVPFVSHPELASAIVQLMEDLGRGSEEKEYGLYSACIFAIEICLATLQSSLESENRGAKRQLEQIMDVLAQVMRRTQHTLTFWVPLLSVFYDAHVPLSATLRDTYLQSIENEEESVVYEDEDRLIAIQSMVHELGDLSTFDKVDHFFAQGHAMPPDFFVDLMIDFLHLEEAQDMACLMLLHPDPHVRWALLNGFEHIIGAVTLTPLSLGRLSHIKYWYPPSVHPRFERWIKQQRVKGAVIGYATPMKVVRVLASAIDGSGAQAVFVHLKEGRKHRLCGVLFKQDVGIKDAWVTGVMTSQALKTHQRHLLDGEISLREVDIDYWETLMANFTALMVNQGDVPSLHVLAIEEWVGDFIRPCLLDVSDFMTRVGVQVVPFTQTTLLNSFKRSEAWLTHHLFTESWYIQNTTVDHLVNQMSRFVDGVRVCDIEAATNLVLTQEMEHHRDTWLFHFIWITLWLKSSATARDDDWIDSFFIAHAIYNGTPLEDIPVLKEIAHQTALNSVETMQERKTHLTRIP